MAKLFFPSCVALAVIVLSCTGCTLPAPFLSRSIHILGYNVENLFDDRDDGTEYRDYDPGSGSWNTSLYHAKLQNISQAISKSVRGGPDICLLQEIESEKALRDLTDGYLNTLGYRHTFLAPRSGSATSVAALSRMPITAIRVHRVYVDVPTRPVLEIEIELGNDILILLNNHWKSKSGGAPETEEYRLEAASLVRSRLRSIISERPEAFIVVSGDLNEGPDEFDSALENYQTALLPDAEAVPDIYAAKSLFLTSSLERAGIWGDRVILYSPWLAGNQLGSYVYKGVWERIDHFLIYDGDGAAEGIDIRDFAVITDEFLLREDATPKRWNVSSASGFSDHLPVLLTLER